jgi:hypothetical protein
MMGNYHVRFLGGLGLATAPGYPVKMVNLEIKGRQIKWHPVILKELGFLK